MGGSATDTTGSVPAVRDLTLDLVKGVLVVLMVVYHAMNIFSTAGPNEYAYVRFVSGSFVLMSGYIVARFHEARFKADWRGTSRRLVVRGLKLLMLFREPQQGPAWHSTFYEHAFRGLRCRGAGACLVSDPPADRPTCWLRRRPS